MAKILLVDDNVELLELVALHLCGANHDVTTATDGREALRCIQEHAFDLIITDIVMPEKEGIETIMEVRRQNSDVKIIAMSGGGSAAPGNYLALAQKLGASETLAKPFSGEELLSMVDRVLSEGP